MAKKALFDVLERTIGKYVLNLDAESLSVAVWSGKIELHSLELDIHAVNDEIARRAAEAPNLAFPFRVTSGQFASFQVDVPWANLTSKSVVLRAQGLSVSVEPFDHLAATVLVNDDDNEAVRASQIRTQRERSLKVADEYRQQALALQKLAEQDLANESTKKSGFGARLVRRIIENIQIEINDVHFSLEGAGFSAGVILDSFQLATTDRRGSRSFVDRTSGKDKGSSFLHKALEVRGLGVYMDGNSTSRRALSAISEDDGSSMHSYIIAPLSFDAKLRQADSTVCRDYPKYLLESEVRQLSVILSKAQLELFRNVRNQLRPPQGQLIPLFPEYRPLVRPQGKAARYWWHYAYRCIGRLKGRRAWLNFIEAYRTRKSYIALYKREAFSDSCPWLTPLDPQEQADMKQIEQDRTISVAGIMTWRTIATGQVERERSKYHQASTGATFTRGSVFKSLFGSTAAAADSSSIVGDINVPPISLSVEEMKQLENMALERVSDTELSSDSRLCDVKFVLGSLDIQLISSDQRPLTGLEMGTVTAIFRASVDGSYAFDGSMISLTVTDRVTAESCFPKILQSLAVTDDLDNGSPAFSAYISRSKVGDQTIRLHLSTFEAVASPKLAFELQKFVADIHDAAETVMAIAHNPVLAQSMSGSVDIFYDANEGGDAPVQAYSYNESHRRTHAGFDPSQSLIVAWKSKTQNKIAWTIDLDIQAPIVIIPQNCVDVQADILVFNLGHFQLRYGSTETSTALTQKTLDWFQENPRGVLAVAPHTDYGSLSVKNLTFAIGKARDRHGLVVTVNEQSELTRSAAVYEPMCVDLAFAVETVERVEIPRMCLFGVVPTIRLNVSPAHVSGVLSVVNAWKDIVGQSGKRSASVRTEWATDPSDCSINNKPLDGNVELAWEGSSTTASPSHSRDVFTSFYIHINLQQLSVKVAMDSSSPGLEAHLVSVSVSTEALSDSCVISRLTMGWFWVLDQLQNDFPRQQRLLAHSKLPRDISTLAGHGYAIMTELEKLGVLRDDFAASSELADISYRTSSKRHGRQFCHSLCPSTAVGSTLDARLTTLNVNWNPRAIKHIVTTMESVFFLPGMMGRHTLLSSQSALGFSTRKFKHVETIDENAKKPMLVKLSMERLELCLNSAKDDLPLFLVAMSRTISSYQASGADMTVSFTVDNLTVATPATGKTLPMYRTILGLSPGEEKSLLSVRYTSGFQTMEFVSVEELDLSGCEAYASVTLSPMRLVYIHAQVLSLAEYATDGILGAITASAASSAAQAAADLAKSEHSNKIFKVEATGLEICLPEAAYSENYLSAMTRHAAINYVSSPPPGGGDASLVLSHVIIEDSVTSRMLKSDVELRIEAHLPPVGLGTVEDQAIRAKLAVSDASFVVSKRQYKQILRSFAANIGEQDLFVRDELDDDHVEGIGSFLRAPAVEKLDVPLTHAGARIVDIPRRIYVEIKLSALTLLLVIADEDEPLIRITALQGKILFMLFGDLASMKAEATLRDLACTDERIESVGRQQRSMVYQDASSRLQDVCFVSFESHPDLQQRIRISLGSPHLVFVPDAIADVLAFFSSEGPWTPAQGDTDESGPDSESAARDYTVAIDATNDEDAFETSLVPNANRALSVTTFDFKTDRCSVLLVDLGSSELLSAPGSRRSVSVSSLAEVLVFEGEFDAAVTTMIDNLSGVVSSVECEFHAKCLEAYTAYGSEVSGPLQILEPAGLSVYVTVDSSNRAATAVSVRVAAASRLDITLSMRNIAHFHAVLASIDDCFHNKAFDRDDVHVGRALTATEAGHAFLRESDSQVQDPQGPFPLPPDASIGSQTPSPATTSQHMLVSIKLTISEAIMTCVNDLQGIDEAIVRLTIQNLTAAAQANEGQSVAGSSSLYTGFQFSLHTSISADYFDSSANLWTSLLRKPWELACKASRGPSNRYSAKRPSTTVDLESFPLHMAFSEQFLMAIASASYMWKIYSSAIDSAIQSQADGESGRSRLGRSVATSAARTLIKSLPYAIENHCGVDIQFAVQGSSASRRLVANGMVEYFKFEPPQGSGRGGRRLYGQDVSYKKSLWLSLDESSIELANVDMLASMPSQAYELSGRLIIGSVLKEGKTVVIHVSSGVDFCNRTFLSFSLALTSAGEDNAIGICGASSAQSDADALQEVSVHKDGRVAKASSYFGVPVDSLKQHRQEWEKNGVSYLTFVVRPLVDGMSPSLQGSMVLKCDTSLARLLEPRVCRHHVICTVPERTPTENYVSPLALDISVATRLINGFPCLDIAFEPRATLVNEIPLSLLVRTPMPHIYTQKNRHTVARNDSIYEIGPGEKIDIFTPGPSIAVTMKCKDLPVAGSSTEWMEGWMDLPLLSEFRLPEPLRCSFPLSRQVADPLAMSGLLGSQFMIINGGKGHSKASAEADWSSQDLEATSGATTVPDEVTSFIATVYNYAVDHTGELLFEHMPSVSNHHLRRSISNIASPMDRRSKLGRALTAPLGAYNSDRRRHRVSLLPDFQVPIRILQLTMEGDEGIRKGSPFCVDDIAICQGGALSTPILWESGGSSGYFAYRTLVSAYQSEVHVIPEYVVFNGSSGHLVLVKQSGGLEMQIAPGKIEMLKLQASGTATISLEYGFGASTSPVQVDALGLRVAVLKSFRGGPIGSVAIQTVVGGVDSRLVVKIGDPKLGSAAAAEGTESMLSRDFIRLRLQCSEICITLEKSRRLLEQKHAFMESALDRLRLHKRNSPSAPTVVNTSEGTSWMDARARREWSHSDGNGREAVCTILMHRCTFDWQRVFKNDDARSTLMQTRDALITGERSQLSLIIHNMQLRDDTPGSDYPVVFDSTSEVNFFDLCVRIRGSVDSELVKVDLFDLNLAHKMGDSRPIVINTSEEFVWILLDLANRIMMAAAEFVGVEIELKWDAEHGGYSVAATDKKTPPTGDETYSPPKSDILYALNKVRVSPFTLLFSFKRVPQSSRYKRKAGFRGANIMNYFTTRLKFKIDQAELKFSRFETRNIRGPPEQLFQMLSTVYVARMKLKFVSIMTAATFQDWKKLASREGGDDEFVEGDILRVAGNIAGNSVNYVLKKAGMGLGQGISTVTHALGDGIESATSAIGAGAVGAGVNSLVSGVGDGVGDALGGVGTGAGKVVKGVGKGVGQVFGGLSGGALMMSKGIGKGIVEGDGQAVATGLVDGATSVGSGVGQGIESLVHGTAGGVFSVGSGIFSGVKTVGQGIGGAFTAFCPSFSCCCASAEETTNVNNALTMSLVPSSSNII